MITFLEILAIVVFIVLLYRGQAFAAWVGGLTVELISAASNGIGHPTLFWGTVLVFSALAVLFGAAPLRRHVLSRSLMKIVAGILPKIGDTERIALEAGTVWWDGDLFSGKPDWKRLIEFKVPPLSEKEQAFLDGPVETFCAMIDDWKISQDRDMSPEAWEFLKKERFFGMGISEKFGGLGFSAIGHSAVVTKIASCSSTAAVTVMVPNSLGPGELLAHYGTEEQKAYHLPRLARGEDIPCFALTEPEAGSDAASGKSAGVICRGSYDGKDVIGIRLNFEKRYITLAPIATVIGLAFRLYDPEHLIGETEDIGITCALLPRGLKGMTIGDRHDPMGVPFQNGPIFGTDVFIPMDFVIGGNEGAGQGWRMLMEALAAGRSISLPALSIGAVEMSARVAGAYGTVREQFNMPIGRFEGIEEALARIGGYAYLMNATRTLTCGAVDAGEKPAVLSAIAKAYLTDGMRDRLNDAMDIRAGSAICRGPRNILGRGYLGVPVAITVEGANILTRSLIIFGQGAIRCHPFVHDEIESIAKGDLARFDRAFFGHIGFVFVNVVRSLLLGLTNGRLAAAPVNGPDAAYYRKLTRFSAAFALLTDVSLAVLGGSLKRREKISGRLADALAWMYMASATLKRFHDEGRSADDAPLMRWACDLALYKIEEAMIGVLDNFPNRWVAGLLCPILFPLGRRQKPPADALGAKIARGLLDGDDMRLRLTRDIFIPGPDTPGLGRLEAALDKVVAAKSARDRVKAALRDGTLPPGDILSRLDMAADLGVIRADEARLLAESETIRRDVIQVDVFDAETYMSLR